MTRHGVFENDGYTVRIDHDPMREGFEIHVIRYGLHGRELGRDYVTVGERGELSLHPMNDGYFPEGRFPTIRCDTSLLRALAGALVDAGYAPTTPAEAEAKGAMSAMSRHLEDMRRLALLRVPAVAP